MSPEQALSARPMRLVEAEMEPTPDGGGRLTAKVKQGRVWLFKLPEGSTKTYEFDTIGVFVWNCIDGKTTVEQIIKRLAKQYDLNLRAAQVPTVKFLEMLIQRGLVGVPLERK